MGKCLPDFASSTVTLHGLVADPGITYLIQWRNPDPECGSKKWFLYGRVYTTERSLRSSLALLRSWRNRNNQPHEYRVVAYKPIGTVKELSQTKSQRKSPPTASR